MNCLYTVSPKGWLDMSRDEKKKISSAIVEFGYQYKRHKEEARAKKDAEAIHKATGIKMDVIKCYPAMMPF